MSDSIYEGIWIDYDRGSVLGWALTVKYRTGIILTTVLAILVTFIANRSWKIWRLLLHWLLDIILRKAGHQQAPSIREQQAVLRNSETAGGALLAFIEILQTGKRSHKRAKDSRIVPAAVILVTLLHLFGFIALGILTAQINIGSNVRSRDSTQCGLWAPSKSLSEEVQNYTSMEKSANQTIAAENYVRNCYITDSSSISECNIFSLRSISHSTSTVPCPFRDSGVCSAANEEAFAMDTGNVSFSDLGINWRHAKQVSIRRRSVCTPIVAEPFLYDDETMMKLYAEQHFGGDIAPVEQITGYAFTVDDSGGNLTEFYQDIVSWDYRVSIVLSRNGSFTVPALEPHDLSPQLVFITIHGGSVHFGTPSADPIFWAQQKVNITLGDTTMVRYVMGRAFNTIACQSMAMLCSNITGYCSNWQDPSQFFGSRFHLSKSLGHLANDTTARAAFHAAQTGWLSSTIYDGLNYRGASALQATRHVQAGRQYLISKEQWKLEVQNWFRIGLAIMQMSPQRMISNPELDRTRVSNVWNSSDPIVAAACGIVKSRSPQHITLSMLGIVIVLVFTAVLTMISYLDQILSWLFPGRQSRSLSRWEKNSYLHLLQAAETDGKFILKSCKLVLTCCSTENNQELQDVVTVDEHCSK